MSDRSDLPDEADASQERASERDLTPDSSEPPCFVPAESLDLLRLLTSLGC